LGNAQDDKGKGLLTHRITFMAKRTKELIFVARVPRIKSKSGINHIIMRGINH